MTGQGRAMPLFFDDGRSRRGFTLLELMISIVILSAIVLIVGGSMRLAYRSVSAGEKKIESLERTRASLSIIGAQIESAAPLVSVDEGQKQVRFEGGRDFLKVATNYSIWRGLRGHVVVEYRVGKDETGKEYLYATESTSETGKETKARLLEGFDSVYFQYFEPGPGLSDEQAGWVEEWTDDAKAPEKVKLVLVLGGETTTFVFPVRVRGLNAQASSVSAYARLHLPGIAAQIRREDA
jgi:prepilin-type N-terminal cleavage/methylation domain-containing protein